MDDETTVEHLEDARVLLAGLRGRLEGLERGYAATLAAHGPSGALERAYEAAKADIVEDIGILEAGVSYGELRLRAAPVPLRAAPTMEEMETGRRKADAARRRALEKERTSESLKKNDGR